MQNRRRRIASAGSAAVRSRWSHRAPQSLPSPFLLASSRRGYVSGRRYRSSSQPLATSSGCSGRRSGCRLAGCTGLGHRPNVGVARGGGGRCRRQLPAPPAFGWSCWIRESTQPGSRREPRRRCWRRLHHHCCRYRSRLAVGRPVHDRRVRPGRWMPGGLARRAAFTRPRRCRCVVDSRLVGDHQVDGSACRVRSRCARGSHPCGRGGRGCARSHATRCCRCSRRSIGPS